jgi:hypothetical protein
MPDIDFLSAGNSRPSPAVRAHTDDVKRWFREGLGLGDDAAITVSEVDCKDPGCPGFETVIAVFAEGQPSRTFKIFLPILEIGQPRVERAIRKAAAAA